VAAGLDESEGLGPFVGARHRLGGALWRRSWLKALALLLPPTGAFLAVYVAALVALFISAFWTVDSFTGLTIHHWTWANFSELWHGGTYHAVALRTILIALRSRGIQLKMRRSVIGRQRRGRRGLDR